MRAKLARRTSGCEVRAGRSSFRCGLYSFDVLCYSVLVVPITASNIVLFVKITPARWLLGPFPRRSGRDETRSIANRVGWFA